MQYLDKLEELNIGLIETRILNWTGIIVISMSMSKAKSKSQLGL